MPESCQLCYHHFIWKNDAVGLSHAEREMHRAYSKVRCQMQRVVSVVIAILFVKMMLLVSAALKLTARNQRKGSWSPHLGLAYTFKNKCAVQYWWKVLGS